MMQIYVVGFLAIIMITGTKTCDNSICFSWTMKTYQLKLICKIRFLHYSVTILDPLGEEKAYCIPPVQYSKCEHVVHGNVEQNLKTNETVVTVWDITSKYNGNWTCLHGIGTGSASTEVFMTPVNGLMEENGHKCIWEFLSWTMIGLVPTFMIVRFVVWMLRSIACKGYSFRLKCDKIKNKGKRLCFKVIAYISLLMLLFGMPILLGLLQGGHCIASEAFCVFGAVVAVIFNLLLDARNDANGGVNNGIANGGENNGNANGGGNNANANGGGNNGNANGGGNRGNANGGGNSGNANGGGNNGNANGGGNNGNANGGGNNGNANGGGNNGNANGERTNGHANGGGNNDNANEERNNCHGNEGGNYDYIYRENSDDDDNVEMQYMLATDSD